MSYTTRCPACGTMFKVVPDQLKISDGWVRCGHCADVFDATLYLATWVPPVPAPAPVPAPGPEPFPEPESPTVLISEPEPVVETMVSDVVGEAAWAPAAAVFPAPIDKHVSEPDVSADAWAVDVPTEAPFPALVASPEPVSDIDTETGELKAMQPAAVEPDDWLVSPESVSDAREQEQAAQTLWRGPVPSPEIDTMPIGAPITEVKPERVMASALRASYPPPPAAFAADEPVSPEHEPDFQTELERFAAVSSGAVKSISADPPLERGVSEPAFTELDDDAALHDDEPGFVRQAKQRAFWRSPGVRAALGVLSLLLALLLATQWALHERDRLAASHPDLAPLLAQLCAPLGCEVGPVRRIEAVVIDSSTLVRRLGNFYAFDLVLKNTAAMPVAVPALELSLTDTRDSVIARRVFLPQELPGNPKLLPAQGALSVSLRLSIADGGAMSMAGYRALVFYP